jgi:Ran GTPase-activating protein (RanGAP) involved in mRNA processing and transport
MPIANQLTISSAQQKIMEIKNNTLKSVEFRGSLKEDTIQNLFAALKISTSLRRLAFFECNLTNHDICQLCSALSDNNVLLVLEIHRNYIGREAIVAIATLISNRKCNIKELCIEDITSGTDTDFPEMLIFSAAIRNSQITSLSLINVGLTDADLTFLALELGIKRLSTLILDENIALTSQSIIFLLSSLLESCQFMQHLSLNGSNIDLVAEAALGSFLQKASNLKTLSIANCFLSTDLIVFAQFLRNHPMLKELILDGNNLGDSTVKSIVGIINTNRHIISISLRDNKISDVGARELADVLEQREDDLSLDLALNSITEQGRRLLIDASNVFDLGVWVSDYGSSDDEPNDEIYSDNGELDAASSVQGEQASVSDDNAESEKDGSHVSKLSKLRP